MQDGQSQAPKQLLSERIKSATNILVTVNRNPSVDELSAALALTLMLNKLDKHATAVFSGKVPPAIEFLNPEKTFEDTVDSLRDFIIALDKDKADRLRYKVEDDVVRIFITPYRTVISDKDLAFSQGDFNVELIIALGVDKREDLDTAITAHGRILHDAVVATINNNNQQSGLGNIDWTDANASGFSEMLMSLSESLQSGILDQQIATALLTGIVAATERFSNTHTTPKVMTMAAQLMAAGANQQLIATRLEESNEIPAQDGSRNLKEGASEKLKKVDKEVVQPAPAPTANGEMHIDHEQAAPQTASNNISRPATPPPVAQIPAPMPAIDNQQDEFARELTKAKPVAPTLSVDDLKKDIAAANAEMNEAAGKSVITPLHSPESQNSDWRTSPSDTTSSEPTFGGTLNATTEEAHDDKEREERRNRNHALLSHDGPSASSSPMNSVSPGGFNDEPPTIDPFAEPPRSEPDSPLQYEPIATHAPTIQPLSQQPAEPPEPSEPTPSPVVEAVSEEKSEEVSSAPATSTTPTLADLEAQTHAVHNEGQETSNNSLSDARAAVNAALDALPFNPASEPLAAAGAQSFPPLHDEEPAPPVAAAVTEVVTPEQPPVVEPVPVEASIPETPPSPSAPPLPDFSTLPPLPEEPAAPPVETTPLAGPLPENPQPQPQVIAAPVANDPGQFRLPGQ